MRHPRPVKLSFLEAEPPPMTMRYLARVHVRTLHDASMAGLPDPTYVTMQLVNDRGIIGLMFADPSHVEWWAMSMKVPADTETRGDSTHVRCENRANRVTLQCFCIVNSDKPQV